MGEAAGLETVRSASVNRPPVSPAVVLIGAVAAVSTGAIFVRFAEAPALVTAAYRVGLATLMFLPFALLRCRGEWRRMGGRNAGAAMVSGLFLAVHFATWISSLSHTTVANSVVLVNTSPLWVALAAPFVTHDRVARRVLLCVLLSVIGCAVITGGGLLSGGGGLTGDGLAVAGAVAAAGYLLIGRRLRGRMSLLSYVTICYGTAALLLWSAVLLLRLPVRGFSGQTYLAFVGMAAISQVAGHSSYNWALKWLSTTLVAVGLLGEPIGSTLLAYFLLHEAVTWTTVMGGAIVLLGIYLVAVSETVSPGRRGSST